MKNVMRLLIVVCLSGVAWPKVSVRPAQQQDLKEVCALYRRFANDYFKGIRPAEKADLSAVLEFDERVTFEYFRPLYQSSYGHFPNGQNPDYYLQQELKADEELFAKCVRGEAEEKLYVAYDDEKKCPVGLLLFHRADGISIELDLLLIDKTDRRLGLGKQLIDAACDVWKEVTTCHVYPLRFGNYATLKFYESMGFVKMRFGPRDKKNAYGVSYEEMHFHYKRTIPKR